MENRNGALHIDEDEARAGATNTGLRWVLAVGRLLAIIAITLLWVVPALTAA
jgi:hypothetical protein